MSAPELSVIIPCFRAADVLPLQLEALADQEDAPQTEILLADNGENGDLRALTSRFDGEGRPPFWHSLSIVDATQERGASYARNRGAAEAASPYLAFCDADDCVGARWLSDAHEAAEQAALVSGTALDVSADKFQGSIASVRSLLGASPDGVKLEPQDSSITVAIVMGGDFVIHRDLFLQLGGFDQSLPTAGEDNDLAMRIRSAGVPLFWTHSMRIAYRRRTGMAERSRDARRASEAHALLCVRYDCWRGSPFVGGGKLVLGTLRLAAACLRVLFDPRRRDWEGVRVRAAGIQGLWVGWLRYRVLRRVPVRDLGAGLSSNRR